LIKERKRKVTPVSFGNDRKAGRLKRRTVLSGRRYRT
jgi:hypothetical protein